MLEANGIEQDVSRHDEISETPPMLSVDEAADLFHRAGVPRSARTIIRYCSQKHLECTKIETERNERYLISKESVESRIEELKQILSISRVQTYPDMSRHEPTSPDTSGHDVPDEKEKDALLQKITSLEKEKQDLQILNAGKDYLVQQYKEERIGLIEQMRADAHRVGELETKLLQLEAPKPKPSADEFTGQ